MVLPPPSYDANGLRLASVSPMSRDHRKLRVFQEADALVGRVYDFSREFPAEERYGLQSQVRRAAVSAVTNIVEGCARRKTGEYVSFLSVATGSAAEAHYLIELSLRLGFARLPLGNELLAGYEQVVRGLKALVNGLDGRQ